MAILLILVWQFSGNGPAQGSGRESAAGEGKHILRLNRTIQITPDASYLTGSFSRINYVPATDRFVVTFGTKKSIVKDVCKGAGFAYKEYTTDMVETGKSGYLIETPMPACEAGDMGSTMADGAYYIATFSTDTSCGSCLRLIKFNATDWSIAAETNVPLDEPHESASDMSVSFMNGLLDVSNQYNPEGIWQEGSASFHDFFTPDLQPAGKKILNDSPHISGASIIFADNAYNLLSADTYSGDLVVLRYDRDWNYLGMKKLIREANWPQGAVFDGSRFYVAYTDTSQRTEPGFFPVYPNAHIAAFDSNWNLLDDLALTNYTLESDNKAGRPWVIMHGGRLYVSYDVDSVDPVTREERLQWQAYVSIIDLEG